MDALYARLMQQSEDYQNLWVVTRKILVLFHGQSAVEGGFSVNQDIMLDNMSEKTVVAQRQVFCAIKNYGGALKVPISENMLKSVRAASTRRRLALEEQRKKDKDNEISRKRKLDLDMELAQIERERVVLAEKDADLKQKAEEIKKRKSAA